MNFASGMTGSARPMEMLQELTTAAGRIPLLDGTNLFIVLASTNDDEGNLSVVAVSRLREALEAVACADESKMILTGGIGEHFNRTNKPHAYYACQFLLCNGLSPSKIVGFVASVSTFEDATLTERFLRFRTPKSICVVTSDFHVERARVLFTHAFRRDDIAFRPARTPLPAKELARLEDHERKALKLLKDKGIGRIESG